MDSLQVRLAFEVRTRAPEVLDPLFAELDADPLLKPDYWGSDERKREPWTKAAADQALGRPARDLFLWRSHVPHYAAMLGFSADPVNELWLDFDGKKLGKDIRAIFDTVDRWAESRALVYGYVHPLWKLGEKSEAYNVGCKTGTKKIESKGLASAYARNYFGPWLADLVGRNRLLSLPNATAMKLGGIRVDLVPDPSEGTFEALSASKPLVVASLREAGVLAESPEGFVAADPAPRWPFPEWHKKKPKS